MSTHRTDQDTIRWKQWVAQVALGNVVLWLESMLFDFVVYGWVNNMMVREYGATNGALYTFCIMVPISIIMCLLYIKFYDWSRTDWLGFEALKELRDEYDGKGFMKRMVRNAMRLGDVPAFFALCVWGDPFKVTIYLRKADSKYCGLRLRDWLIFWAAVLVSNGFWTLSWTGLWTAPEWTSLLFEMLPPQAQDALSVVGNYIAGCIEYAFSVLKEYLNSLQ